MEDNEMNPTNQIVEAWFEKWFHNQSGISDNTMLYNRLREAVEDLKTKFDGGVK